MATAVHLPSSDAGAPLNEAAMGLVSPNSHSHSTSYSKRLTLTEFDLRDDRYPSLSSTKPPVTPSARSQPGGFDPAINAGMTAAVRASYEKTYGPDTTTPQKSWLGENITQEPVQGWDPSHSSDPVTPAILEVQSEFPGSGDTPRQAGNPPVEPYRLDEPVANRLTDDGAGIPEDPPADTTPRSPDMGQRSSSVRPPGDQYEPVAVNSSSPRNVNLLLPLGAGPSTPAVSPVAASSSPRYPSLPAVGVAASPSTSAMPPIVPMSAGPTYNPSAMQIPISPKPRAYAQHPTYITPSTAPAMQPSFSPPQVQKEEICVECAMRDQDMADVDVTSPGVWDRESDVLYEELCRRDIEEEGSGHSSSENHSRPRAKGGKLTEENLRFWLSINPKEPSSRQQTLDQYVKLQRSLLEADSLARARALRESRLLDEKMRDTFSQLRRSAYELGSSSQPVDDYGALRIKSPRVASMPSTTGPAQGHSREVTLLENGMIVEHVDLRKEEKEEKDRKRKEERRERSRARKSSRSSRSAADIASVHSMPLASPLPQMDSGFFSNARDSRYSQSFSPRPSSVLATGGERPQTLLRAQSQASFSDMQSIGSASSPRRSRFFGFKNLSAAWLSRDSMAPSGSMIDMHVALQQEQQYFAAHPSAVDISSNTSTLRASQLWPRTVTSPEPVVTPAPATIKKKNGFKKIWKLVTGSSKGSAKGVGQSRSVDRHEDDAPLAPPPPLSYLVEREGSARRHVSTPSLLSSVSPNQFSQWAPSPPTAPSSALPSPTSSRYPAIDRDFSGEHQKDQAAQELVVPDHRISALELGASEVTPTDLDTRGRSTHSSSRLSMLSPISAGATPANRPHSAMIIRRDKSLPPLPGEPGVEFPAHPMPDTRPQTMYDLLQAPHNPIGGPGLLPPRAPFRTAEVRRQSFGGMGSMPHYAVQSLPSRNMFARGAPNVPPFLAEEKYVEFGASSPSLAQWGTPQVGKRSLTTPAKPKQRRSKFGLASIFGKKSTEMERESQAFPTETSNGSMDPLDYNPYQSSASDQRDEPSWNGGAGPGSAHSSAPRMSVMSKNIVELVEQDPEFVAYRYPSSDQRLEVLR